MNQMDNKLRVTINNPKTISGKNSQFKQLNFLVCERGFHLMGPWGTRTRSGMLGVALSLLGPKYLVGYAKLGSTCCGDKLNTNKSNETMRQTLCIV